MFPKLQPFSSLFIQQVGLPSHLTAHIVIEALGNTSGLYSRLLHSKSAPRWISPFLRYSSFQLCSSLPSSQSGTRSHRLAFRMQTVLPFTLHLFSSSHLSILEVNLRLPSSHSLGKSGATSFPAVPPTPKLHWPLNLPKHRKTGILPDISGHGCSDQNL